MIVTRVEKHIIKNTNVWYSMLDNFCFLSKNLYNHGLYLIRQEFINNKKIIDYCTLDKILKQDKAYPDYRNMPTAQSAQQTLRVLCKTFKSFLHSISDYSKHKEKYTGKPKIPRYKPKNGRYSLILTNQNVNIKNNILIFPKIFKGFTIEPICIQRKDFHSFQQVRFIPNYKHIIVEVVYKINIPDTKINNNNYLGIDIGINNLLTISNNFNKKPIIINGKGLKSINQFYNKEISYYKSICKRMNNLYTTNRINKITIKRNNKVLDFLHKVSRYLVNYAITNNVSKIIIGYNKGWKQEVHLGKINNQKLVQIPFKSLIKLITYKCNDIGIEVITTEESYTSGTSFLDYELPIKENYSISRRKHRGLFISNENIPINADVNSGLQIIKKVFPNVFTEGIEDLVLNPVKVNLNI